MSAATAAISALTTVGQSGFTLPDFTESLSNVPIGAVYFAVGFILACAIPTLSRAGFAAASLARLFKRR